VRVIDEFVNLLSFGELRFESGYQRKTEAGRPRYSAECLLKLYVYGYYMKVRSSRRLMELCATNIEAMWLTGRLRPDFRTISDFRKENKSGIKKVFTAFVKISAELGLYHREAGVQDGSKFRAVNSKDKNVTEAKLAKKLEIAEEKIAKYLEEMDKNDRGESDGPKYTKEEIAAKIETLREKKERYGDLLEEMKEKGLTQASFTDPESKLMKMANGGFNVSYNIQIIVDPESHMVGTVMVTDHCNDMGLLSPVTEKAKEELGTVTMEVTADKGYEDSDDMLESAGIARYCSSLIFGQSGADCHPPLRRNAYTRIGRDKSRPYGRMQRRTSRAHSRAAAKRADSRVDTERHRTTPPKQPANDSAAPIGYEQPP
jgi:transposase